MRASCAGVSLSSLALWLPASRVESAGVPVGFVDTRVADGLTSPTAMALTPDRRVLVTFGRSDIVHVSAAESRS